MTTLDFTLAFERDLRAIDAMRRMGPAPTPPSGAMLAVVRQFGEAETRDDGLTLYRLRAHQIGDPDIAAMLGDERERALDVSLLWDDREEQLVEVLDEGALRRPTLGGLSYADLKVRADRRPSPRASYARAA